jgi:pantothenate kinase
MSSTAAGPVVLQSFDDVLRRAAEVAARGGRRVIGIAGGPGSGKTTIATAVVAALNEVPAAEADGWVAHVPMDGFHLADVELARLGRLDRKGAPDTFDAAGYAALLRRIRTAGEATETVYAPAFDRDVEQPIAGAIPVPPECRLVVTEGNYLLLDQAPWQRVRRELDEVWYVDVDDELRRRRLVERHVRFGKSPAAARAWVRDVDEANAREIAAFRELAEVLVPASVLQPGRSS